jgi:molybdopterin converting factor small subunit
MNRVTIELWFWMGKELGKDFESQSEMCSYKQELIEEGTTIRQWLYHLAGAYPSIAEKVFDLTQRKLYPHVVLNYNDRVINPHRVHDQVLRDGDKITILPMYMGG